MFKAQAYKAAPFRSFCGKGGGGPSKAERKLTQGAGKEHMTTQQWSYFLPFCCMRCMFFS